MNTANYASFPSTRETLPYTPFCWKTMASSVAWMKMNKWRIETLTYLTPGVRYQHPLCNFHCILPGCPSSGVWLSIGCRLVLPPHSVGYRFPTRWFAYCCLGLSLSHPDGPTYIGPWNTDKRTVPQTAVWMEWGGKPLHASLRDTP